MVIEDNDGDYVLAREAIATHSQQIELSRAKTLADGLDQIMTKTNIDLILVDLHLPDSIGTSTILLIKEITDIPIVVLTGNDDDEMIVDSIRCGAYNFLHKSEMNGNLRRAILTAKAKSDCDSEKRKKLLETMRKYFPPTAKTEPSQKQEIKSTNIMEDVETEMLATII